MTSGQVDFSEAEPAALRSAFDRARDGSTVEILRFLNAGVPVDLTNGRSDTLLILVAYHCHPETVEALLARGADVSGQSALASAVFRERADLVRLLLSAGADPDDGQKSARAVAEFFGRTGMLSLLSA